MTSKRWLRKRLYHTCTIERDNGTAQSNTGMVGTAWTNVGSGIVCRYYEHNEFMPDEDLGRITVKTRHLILDEAQDIAVNDRVNNLADENGTAIVTGNFRVERLVTPRDIYAKKYYRIALLEKVETN